MSNLFWLNNKPMARLKPFFPSSHGKLCVDDRRVLRGIIFNNRNGLLWYDAPRQYGLPKMLYSHWKQWGEMGVFARMMEGLAARKTGAASQPATTDAPRPCCRRRRYHHGLALTIKGSGPQAVQA